MSQLKKYTDFKELKSEIKTVKPGSPEECKLLPEFEAFLLSLQQQFSNTKPTKLADGK